MCLSTVYKLGADSQEPEEVCSNVSSFEVSDNGSITFTDLMGDEYVVEGSITKVDFVSSKIFVAA